MGTPEWVLELRSCLTSVKGSGIPLGQIETDLFNLTGTRIPYKNLGFPSLEACLKSSGQFTIQNRGGVSIVYAVASNKTQHLTELINKQKSKPPKKKPFFGSKFAPRKYNTSSSSNRPNHYSKPGNSSSYNGHVNSRYQGSISNYKNHKSPSSYNNSKSNQYNGYQSKTYDQNNYNKPRPLLNTRNYSKNTNDYYGNHQSNYGILLAEIKTLQQSNLINDNNKNYVKSVPITNNTVPLNVNGKKLPHTSSCSSLESTYSSSSASYTPKYSATNSMDKFQTKNSVNNTASQIVNINDKDKIPKNNMYTQEKNNELRTQHISHSKIPSLQNMPIKLSTAQSRLSKYPKKCDESLNKVNGKEIQLQNEESLADQITDLKIDVVDIYLEVNDDHDYIEELETYLKNLNLSEPYYEFMVKKEKSGKTIKLTHICMIKVNDKNVCSSFPVECSTQDYAKKVAAKHTLSALKKQYGESVIYPITSDINTMASRIKEFLKQGYQETGLLGDVLERMYREQFEENLPDNWIQLLEVFSYFMFDKLVANKIIIYLNEVENNHQNGHESSNGCIIDASVDQNIVPGTSLTLEDYNEKSVLVSANYGSANIWIRFVGQNADENYIQMQAKFNDIMNTSGFSIVEQVTEGEYYAVLYNSNWHRVQISSATEEDDTVTCFMIDTGEQLNIAKDQICYLEPVFMKTKIQAIQCALTQLDYFDTFYGLKELLDEMILNKTFFLLPDTLEEGYLPGVTLYEKKSGVSDRVNINEIIIQRFLEKIIPRLPSFEENAIVDGTVSSVVESGHLNLQLNSDIVSSLEEILPNEEFLSPEYFLKNKEEVKKDQVYLIKYETENMWCRVQVIELKDDSKAQIIYIDYGNIDECEITKLAKLDSYNPLMAKIAPQAVKVSLHLLPPSIMTPGIADKIFEILGGESKVLVNVINAPTNEVPLVNLFKNLPDTPDTPLCINMQIAQSLKKQ